MMADVLAVLLVALTGLVFGSFVTCASWRWPREKTIRGRSQCPACQKTLRPADLVPFFSWIFSRGRCRQCGVEVPARYPLTELATAALFLLIYSRYGLTPEAGVLMLTATALMIMIVADLETYIIPDEVHLMLLPLGILWHWLRETPWDQPVSGLLLGGGIGLSLHYGWRYIRKKEGLGFGDVKFLAVAGLWLGPLGMVPFLFFSGLFGVFLALVWRALGKGAVFPFGPALAAALFSGVMFTDLSLRFWELSRALHGG